MQSKNRLWRIFVASLVALMGTVNILSALLAHGPGRIDFLRTYLPLSVLHATRILTVVVGVSLFLLAYGIYRGKAQAFRFVLVALLLSVVTHLIKGLDYEESLGNITLVLALLLLRSQFTARSDPPSVRRGLAAVGGTFILVYLYGIWGFYFLDGQFNVNFSLPFASIETFRQFFTLGDTSVYPTTPRGHWFLLCLDVTGFLSLAYGFFMVLRPVVIRKTHYLEWDRERTEARTLAEAHGKSSLASLNLLPDKLYHFSLARDAFVGYAQIGNVGIALGDPIGREESLRKAIGDFRDFCKNNDWYPAFYQVSPDYLNDYEQAGFRALKIGEEAIVSLATFSTSGNHWRAIRSSNNKLVREGYSTVWYEPGISDELIRDLRGVSNNWLAHMHGSEKRFSLGWFDEEYLRSTSVITVEGPTGTPVAFANLVREFQRNCIGVDLMRYHRDAPKGVIDLLFVRIAEHGRDNMIEEFNLGLAPLSAVGQNGAATPAEKAVYYLYRHFNRFYSFEGLRSFKEKYMPGWEPRYLIYTHEVLLPKIALAIIRADSPAGLLGFLK